jgi:hypothetical protein
VASHSLTTHSLTSFAGRSACKRLNDSTILSFFHHNKLSTVALELTAREQSSAEIMLQRSDESGKEPSFGPCFKLFVSTHIPDLNIIGNGKTQRTSGSSADDKTGFYTLLLFTSPILILDQGPHTAIHLIFKFQNKTRTSNTQVIIVVVPRRLIILQQTSVACTKIFFLEGTKVRFILPLASIH